MRVLSFLHKIQTFDLIVIEVHLFKFISHTSYQRDDIVQPFTREIHVLEVFPLSRKPPCLLYALTIQLDFCGFGVIVGCDGINLDDSIVGSWQQFIRG